MFNNSCEGTSIVAIFFLSPMEWRQLIERSEESLFWSRRRKRGRNMWNRCGNTTVSRRFRCRFDEVYSCFHCCGHSGTVPLFYMFSSSDLNVHGNTKLRSGNTFFSCFRWGNQTECRRKYQFTFRKQIFLLFLLTYSDQEGTETLGFVPETLFFLVSSIYWTLSVLVILDFPLSLQDR